MEKEYKYTSTTVEKAIKKGLSELGLKEEQVKIEVVEAGSSGFLGLFKKLATVRLVPLVDNVEEYIEKAKKEKEKSFDEKVEDKVNKFEKKITEFAIKTTEKVIDKAIENENIKVIVNDEVAVGIERKEALLEAKETVIEKLEKSNLGEKKSKREDYIVTNKDKIVNYLENIVRSMGYEDASVEFKHSGSRIFTLVIHTKENTSLIIGKRGITLNSLQFLVNNYAKRFSSHFFRIIVDCDNYRETRKKTLEELAINLAKKSKKLGRPVDLEPMTSEERKIIHNALSGIKNVETESRGEEPYRYLVIHAK